MMYGGTLNFEQQVINEVAKQIIIGSHEAENFMYIGFNLTQENNFSIVIDQFEYTENLKEIPNVSSHSKEYKPHEPTSEHEKSLMRSAVGKLNWLASVSRPDISYHVCQLSTIILNATQKDILKLNKVIKDVKHNPVSIKIPSFENLSNLQLLIFADAAFANLPDKGSQGG